MRSLFRISLALLAMGFLALAGSAYAQEMAKPTFTITGDAGAAFGSFTFDKTAASPSQVNKDAAASASNGQTSVASNPCGGTTNLATCTGANTKGYSEYVTTWESNVRLTWTTDQFNTIVRYRIRGSNEGAGQSGNFAANNASQLQSGSAYASSANDVYGEAWWTPAALFKLGIGKFQGQAWSQPLSGTYLVLNPIDVAGGASEYWMNWTGISGLDAELNFGVVQVGIAVSSQCKPSCNVAKANGGTTGASTTYTTQTSGTVDGVACTKTAPCPVPTTALTSNAANSEDSTMSLVPHLTGKVGDISFRAQLPQTSGTINNVTNNTPSGSNTVNPSVSAIPASGSKSVSGSGYQAGVEWDGPAGLMVAADIGSFNDAKVAALSEAKSHERDSYNVKVNIPGGPGFITLAYFTISDNNSANGVDTYGVCGSASACKNKGDLTKNTYTSTIATLRYNLPVGSLGWIIPEYRASTFGGGVTPGLTSAAGTSATDKQKDAADSEFRLIMQGRF